MLPVLAAPGSLAPAVARAYTTPRADAANSPEGAAAEHAFAQRDVHALAAELAAYDNGPGHPGAAVVSESDNTLVRLVTR